MSERRAGLTLAATVLVVAAFLALWGGVAYVALHFIVKFW